MNDNEVHCQSPYTQRQWRRTFTEQHQQKLIIKFFCQSSLELSNHWLVGNVQMLKGRCRRDSSG